MIADMSSDIFSRPVDVSKYALIYAGAQKNVGPSGATLVIVKDELLGKFQRQVPTMMDYRTHINDGSMFNTPCTVAVYTCMEQMTYYKELGGIAGIQKINQEKADLLYNEIERNKAFRCTVPNPEDRSQMNITFILNDEFKANEAEFEALAKKAGIDGIKGHRSVGGYRASTYNSLKIESVQALVQVMKDFEASL
jgi:phosphoserine aminotransferase